VRHRARAAPYGQGGGGLQRSEKSPTAKANKRVQFGYGLNYLIDIKYAVIVDVDKSFFRYGKGDTANSKTGSTIYDRR
jgi:hypothetical protein